MSDISEFADLLSQAKQLIIGAEYNQALEIIDNIDQSANLSKSLHLSCQILRASLFNKKSEFPER